MAVTASDICKIIFAIILPPLGVFLERGCGADLLINCLLTLLACECLYDLLRSLLTSFCFRSVRYFLAPLSAILTDHSSVLSPGIIHALYIILKY
ncbi:plasma membrane proteolipid 3 [Suillus placidus]|uniref:Plasma membrane proteolipid 3 n=1 Tax=Suillus placidus TaxID=48579 RepID=A0A9P7A5C3_9AGAM|nr:plasma membrane proteolipid 3 [Suillus placidus]